MGREFKRPVHAPSQKPAPPPVDVDALGDEEEDAISDLLRAITIRSVPLQKRESSARLRTCTHNNKPASIGTALAETYICKIQSHTAYFSA
eukprot:jgi/Hompol1/6194/HPOL_004871-RA